MTDSDAKERPGGTDVGRLRAEWLEMLLDVSRRINAEVNPGAVLEAIVDSLVSITEADRGFLMLRDEEGELVFQIARDRKGRPLEEKKFELCMGAVEEVAASGETRLIDDAAAADAWKSRLSVISLSLRAILCVPLKTQRGVVGVIYVDSNAITRRFTERDIPLVEAFAAQAAAAVERIHLQRAVMDRDRMRRQLRIAAEIQRTFLLSRFPSLDGVTGALASIPALEVGGDFYDVIRMPGNRVGVFVGDVSGKGVPGALFGARLLSDVRYEALCQNDVGATLTAVNRLVAAHSTRGMFVTFLYVVLDPSNRSVEFANAGHVPPLVRSADGRLEEWSKPRGIPLGIVPDMRYEAGERRLSRGQTLLLLTDGLSDAVRPDGERFGMERLRGVVAREPGDPAALVDALRQATTAFTGRRRQADDQTLLAVTLG